MKPTRLACLFLPLLFAGCATTPSIGASGAKTVVTGSAGGASANNANSQLERCDKTPYNQMVRAVRNYKAQSVAGGLGNGGVLKTN